MDTPTHYELLCVTPEATADEIRNAYRRLIRLYHPDVSGAAGEAMTLRLNEAKRDLLDPALRAQYDRAHLYAGAGARAGATRSAAGPTASKSRINDDWRPPPRAAGPTVPASTNRARYRAWMTVSVASIAAIVTITAVVFAWSYSGPLGLTTPRVIPPLVIAVGWIVGGFSRPSRFFVAMLAFGSALWPLVALGVTPFSMLSDSIPPVILAALTMLGIAVLALRISAPLVTRLSRYRAASA
ncbi:J domain-containing protein [Glaciihabitans sp. INWT7]|uniref:J domain-containing protein n=1 Tax=Glaciihabitans sp. INWT7 TaxID=2596912 RepID=UPI0016269558|nr:J domain-containing protein [Glaciihabitans sp. INWT7]QNE47557.1 J domain-containing protein [Glaciihabitans sp. INWT7]